MVRCKTSVISIFQQRIQQVRCKYHNQHGRMLCVLNGVNDRTRGTDKINQSEYETIYIFLNTNKTTVKIFYCFIH